MTSPVSTVELQAGTKIEAQARGTDTGTLILCGTGVALFVAACFFLTKPALPLVLKVVAAVGAFGGIVIAGIGAAHALSSRKDRNKVETPITEIVMGVGVDQAVVRTAHIETPSDLLRVMRGLIRERKPLPPPHGRVIEREGSRFAVEPYSEAEGAAYATALVERERERDVNAFKMLRTATGSAISSGLEAPPAHLRDDSTVVTIGPIDIDPNPSDKR